MDSSLNSEQQRAYEAILAGRSIFITGPGGTGKSFLLQTLYANYKGRTGKKLSVTALTGCAALLLGPWAKTLHSWAGIGLGRGDANVVARMIAANRHKKKNWRSTNCLVIDEVSMLSPSLLEFLDVVARHVRKVNTPMGGLQVVFVGDFFQLPPVSSQTQDRAFAFESPLWSQIVTETIHLRMIIRQADLLFQTILNEARLGDLSPESYAALEARKTMDWKRQEIKPTLLFTKNMDADAVNVSQLEKLPGEAHVFLAKAKIPPTMPVQLRDYLLDKLDKEAPYEIELKLKERAQVMLITNKDPEAGLVNGSRGVVTGFTPDGAPLVKFLRGPPIPVRVDATTWSTEGDTEEEMVSREQIPLRLAYAMTIHRIQGSTLDSALVDVGPSTFEFGQAYVALSRVRSLDSLYIFEIHPKAFRAHPAVKAFYSGLDCTTS